jgi:S-adenosylmethionine/arginine decarboxylase-like enzyme
MAKLHKHMIVHAEVANPPLKADERAVEEWLTSLVHQMGMEVLRPASAAYCEQVGNRGMTADILITTSHIMLHTWDECEVPFIEFDVYTCSELEPQMVIDAIQRFEPTKVSYKFLDRYDGLTDLEDHNVFEGRDYEICYDEDCVDCSAEEEQDEAPRSGRTIGDALVEIVEEYNFWIWLLILIGITHIW